MPLLPTADCLLIERRRCRKCGNATDVASPRLHRLLHSCQGEPRKLELISHSELEKRGEVPHLSAPSTRTVHILEVPIDACIACWTYDLEWEEASLIFPIRPREIEVPEPKSYPSLDDLI